MSVIDRHDRSHPLGRALRLPGLLALAGMLAVAPGLDAQEGDEADRDCVCMPDVERLSTRIRSAFSRARLGITLDPRRDEDRGVPIDDVARGSGAEDAGLEPGDLITAINGNALAADGDDTPTERLFDLMADVEPGDEVTVQFERDGERREVEVKTTDAMRAMVWSGDMDDFGEFRVLAPRAPRAPRMPDVRIVRPSGLHYRMATDMRLVEMNRGLSEYFGTDRGVLVAEIDEDSELGLRSGDVILAIDGRSVDAPGDVHRILGSYLEDETFELRIVRDGSETTVTGRHR